MAYDHIRQFWDGLGERASGLAWEALNAQAGSFLALVWRLQW